MDVTNMKRFVIVVLVVLMLAGHATSKFEQCFPPCYYGCILEMKGNNPALPDPKKLLPCAWKCLKQCAIDKPPLDLTATTHSYPLNQYSRRESRLLQAWLCLLFVFQTQHEAEPKWRTALDPAPRNVPKTTHYLSP
ncbi:hypothetical protein RJ640_008646 [Escallonia rubra]|uniref:Uncharacterized protein n=1 Tax=Escallonia rubra TaxID=112253 RepID=A0AA88RSR8_9ASTE|nr:hypothetical protein RJ640_008646 [Escallonia rubra]